MFENQRSICRNKVSFDATDFVNHFWQGRSLQSTYSGYFETKNANKTAYVCNKRSAKFSCEASVDSLQNK